MTSKKKCIWGSWGCLLQDYDASVIIMEMYIGTNWHNFKGHGKKNTSERKTLHIPIVNKVQIVRPLDLTLNRLSKIQKDLIFQNWLCKNGQVKEKK